MPPPPPDETSDVKESFADYLREFRPRTPAFFNRQGIFLIPSPSRGARPSPEKHLLFNLRGGKWYGRGVKVKPTENNGIISDCSTRNNTHESSGNDTFSLLYIVY